MDICLHTSMWGLQWDVQESELQNRAIHDQDLLCLKGSMQIMLQALLEYGQVVNSFICHMFPAGKAIVLAIQARLEGRTASLGRSSSGLQWRSLGVQLYRATRFRGAKS